MDRELMYIGIALGTPQELLEGNGIISTPILSGILMVTQATQESTPTRTAMATLLAA